MLLIDIGNSRIKSALRHDQGLERWPTLPTRVEGGFDGWPRVPAERRPARVLVSNVAGADIAGELAQHVFARWGVEAEFVRPRPACAGMSTDYDDPAQLGVDRWLAALGAWHAARGAVCVVDAGTALTVDVVTAHGRHRGGLIAPGLALMRESLARGTAGLPNAEAEPAAGFATNTASAIALGCTQAIAGLLGEVRTRLEAEDAGDALWFLTGGAAPAIERLVRWSCSHDPDLVLRGLEVVAEHPA